MNAIKMETAVMIGTLVSVVLLVLYLKDKQSSGQTRVEPTFQVSSVDPNVAAFRSNERIAGIGANRDIALGWIGLQTSKNQTAAAITINAQDVERDKVLGIANANAVITASNNERDASIQASNYAYQSVMAASKAKSKSDIFGSIFGAIGKVFGGVFGH